MPRTGFLSTRPLSPILINESLHNISDLLVVSCWKLLEVDTSFCECIDKWLTKCTGRCENSTVPSSTHERWVRPPRSEQYCSFAHEFARLVVTWVAPKQMCCHPSPVF
mmetsp:Transcript_15489/g.35189  ORF Transcript_15489/g.35189 Transcript_15489/m.35189 type:complete len:108 (-) Transcript_15489:819-1142(-)